MQKTIRYQNLPLIYEVRGNGLPVLLVHGFTEDRSIWDPLVSGMPEKYRWLIPDLPGSGDSPFNKDLHTLADFAAALQAILQEEGIGQPVLIGHSMGGYIALAFAEKHPGILKGLGLFHSTAYADREEKKESRRKSIEFIRNHGSAPYVQQSLPGLFSDRFKKQHPGKIREQIERHANFDPGSLVQYLEVMMNRKDKTRILEEMDIPALFIMGEEDQAIPLKDMLEQCHLPRISYIHILAETAHMGMLENTNLCNSFVDRYLEEISQ